MVRRRSIRGRSRKRRDGGILDSFKQTVSSGVQTGKNMFKINELKNKLTKTMNDEIENLDVVKEKRKILSERLAKFDELNKKENLKEEDIQAHYDTVVKGEVKVDGGRRKKSKCKKC